MNVPCGFANFAIDPLYSSLILNGADLGDADFVPGIIKKSLQLLKPSFSVSAGFLIACAACSYFIVYSFFLIWRYEEPEDVPVEAEKTLDDVTKDRADTNGSKKEEFSSAL